MAILQIVPTEEIMEVFETLYDVPQRPDYHPEGDVGIHTDKVMERVSDYNDATLYIAAIFHDFGKIDTTKINPRTGMYSSFKHELYSLGYIKKFRTWIEENDVKFEDVYYLIRNHIRAHQYVSGKITNPRKRKTIEEHPLFTRMMILERADDMLRDWEGIIETI